MNGPEIEAARALHFGVCETTDRFVNARGRVRRDPALSPPESQRRRAAVVRRKPDDRTLDSRWPEEVDLARALAARPRAVLVCDPSALHRETALAAESVFAQVSRGAPRCRSPSGRSAPPRKAAGSRGRSSRATR